MKREFKLRGIVIKVVILSFITILYQKTLLGQDFFRNDNPPTYLGGIKALKEFIDDNLIFPDSIKKMGICGIVLVSFEIDKDGKTENVKLVRGIHPVCDSEAIRVTRLLGNWQSAIKMGKPINSNILMPIEFRSDTNYCNNQPVVVKGVVTEKITGKPIEGTLILVRGTNIATITDTTGRYSLEISGEYFDLEISSIGYLKKVVQIGKNRTINVELDAEYFTVNFN